MDAIDTIKILGSLLGNGALSKGSGGNVLGSILGSALGQNQNQQTQGGGAIGDILGGLLGGGQQSGSGGAMGDILGSLLGGGSRQQPQSGGGLGDLLGSLVGGQSQQAPSGGGMGDLLGSILGGSGGSQNAGLGGLLTGALTKYAQVQNPQAPTPAPDNFDMLPQGIDPREAQEQAALIIRAMINAAKSDGNIDEAEQEKIIAKLGDITQAEADFVRSEFRAPLNVDEFVRSIPRGMEQQIYAVSLMAINLDDNKEAQYLDQLARGLGIQPQVANQIHEQLGAPVIYS